MLNTFTKCTMIIFNKHAIGFVQFFTNGLLFLLNFKDLQQHLNQGSARNEQKIIKLKRFNIEIFANERCR
jgi:hypothetical protein